MTKRFFGRRLRTATLAVTLLGVIVVGGPTTAGAASTLSWSTTPSPLDMLVAGSPNSQIPFADVYASLRAVSCASTRFCVAIGGYDPYTNDATLTEMWDGHRWSVAPRSAVANAYLGDVSCPTRRFCAVVGASYAAPYSPYNPPPPPATSTLTEIWDGNNWSIAASPNTASPDNQLSSISCLNRWSCIAVGSSSNLDGTNPHALIEAWNGTAWSIVASPRVGNTSALGSVSCTTKVFCLALGSYVDASAVSHTLAEQWNGTTWTVVTSPHAATGNVSCVGRSFCMATGAGYGRGIERWNGSAWTTLATPIPAFPYSASFESVTCTSRSFCIAVDSLSGPTPGAAMWAIVEWDGVSWSAPDRTASGGESTLLGTSCANSRYCFAVGGYRYPFASGTQASLGQR